MSRASRVLEPIVTVVDGLTCGHAATRLCGHYVASSAGVSEALSAGIPSRQHEGVFSERLEAHKGIRSPELDKDLRMRLP